jgi:hypothetical protein
MSSKETISFALKTTDISSDDTYANYFGFDVATDTGFVTNNRCTYTWYNVDLRKIIGPMYDKYEEFNISLNTFGLGSNGTFPTSLSYYIKLSGLSFFNTQSPSVICNCVKVAVSTSQITTFPNSLIHTFRKSTEKINLTIDIHMITSDTYPPFTSAGQIFGHTAYIFNISGVEKYTGENNSVDTRLRI